ncbi:MAG: hypothetical protein M1818_002001 [Claussenomyces sp. TS43310]|nr:MAG: hypothetical protein M1818_002001 [Claussenomyces sp. TS43310]
MKGKPIDQLVYEYMFPKDKECKPSDPQNFHGLLQKYLVQEVRAETSSFYGSLSTREAQYPGLDYSNPRHRARLSRFTWHRRLFRALDALQLTHAEIAALTKWEGTRWAKERFEKEQGITIRDTTGDCISDWVPPALRKSGLRPASTMQQPSVTEMEHEQPENDAEDMDDDLEDDSDIEMESVGVELNERLRRAVAQREAGDDTVSFDAEFEQWLKEAAEASGENAANSLPRILGAAMRELERTSHAHIQRRGLVPPASQSQDLLPTSNSQGRAMASLNGPNWLPRPRGIVLATPQPPRS